MKSIENIYITSADGITTITFHDSIIEKIIFKQDFYTNFSLVWKHGASIPKEIIDNINMKYYETSYYKNEIVNIIWRISYNNEHKVQRFLKFSYDFLGLSTQDIYKISTILGVNFPTLQPKSLLQLCTIAICEDRQLFEKSTSHSCNGHYKKFLLDNYISSKNSKEI